MDEQNIKMILKFFIGTKKLKVQVTHPLKQPQLSLFKSLSFRGWFRGRTVSIVEGKY